MNKETKKRLCITLAAAVLVTVPAGCEKTPDTAVVTEKNQERMLAAAENGGENSFPLSSYEIPERIKGDWKGVGDLVTVHVDAAVTLPNAQAIPTGTVGRRNFTQEDVDHMLAAFVGDNTFYKEKGFTKQDALAVIELYQEILRGERPVGDAGEHVTMEDIPGYLEDMTEQAKILPDESERFLASRTLEPDEEDWYDAIVEGCAEVDGRTVHIRVCNFDGYGDEAVYYVDGFEDYHMGDFGYIVPYGLLRDTPQGNISEAEALAAGEETMKNLGFTDVVCDKITQVAYIEDYYTNPEARSASYIIGTGYELEFVRCLGGVPVCFTTPYLSGNSIPENEEYMGAWQYERMKMEVTRDGVVYFRWSSPYTDPVVETQDTQLLGFDDVQDIFQKMIFIKNGDLTEMNERNGMHSTIHFDVDEVRLGLMRIRSNGNVTEGLIIPVWDFWGTETFYADDDTVGWEEHTVLLTVNAIDGTVVDREFGY